LFGAALNWCSDPSTGDVERATIGVLRELHAYSSDPSTGDVERATIGVLRELHAYSQFELHQYLTNYHPSILAYSQAMLVTAAMTAARHVASKFHIFMQVTGLLILRR